MTIMFLVLSFISLIIGLYLVMGISRRAREKTTKKLGYGPVLKSVGEGSALVWPKNYYSSLMWLYPIKRQYKNKVKNWMKEYRNNLKEHLFYFILGWLFIIGFFVLFIYYLYYFANLTY